MNTRYSMVFLFLLVLACSSNGEITAVDVPPLNSTADPETDTQSFRTTHGDFETATAKVLFVGNSLTYSNDLPKLVYELVKSRNQEIYTKMIAKPNYALIDHLDSDSQVEEEISSGKYDYVVVQQGPSSLPESRKLLFEGGRRFSALCRASDTELAFFMVWPSRGYYHTFDGVIKNHTDVAAEFNAILCPVGSVWKNYFDTTGDYSYYGPDEFHPSLAGSKVAARTIVNSVFKER